MCCRGGDIVQDEVSLSKVENKICSTQLDCIDSGPISNKMVETAREFTTSSGTLTGQL
jgi:hypothetical protein